MAKFDWKIIPIVVTLTTFITTTVTGIYHVLAKIDRNTQEIEHVKELHDKDRDAHDRLHYLIDSKPRRGDNDDKD